MMMILSGLAVAAMVFVSGIHVYWAFGGTWGSRAALPAKADGNPVFLPGAAATLTVAAGLLAAAFLLAAQSGMVPGIDPGVWIRRGCMALAAVFFLRVIGDFRYFGMFKKQRSTRFARNDTVMYTPLCLILGLAYVLALV